MVTNVTASNNLKWSNNTQYGPLTSPYQTWVKMSTITPAYNVTGSIRVYYEYNPGDCYECYDPAVEGSYFEVRKNGVRVGTTQLQMYAGWYSFTEDISITLTTIDTLELWAYFNNTIGGAYVQNFRVSFDSTVPTTGDAYFTSNPSGARIWVDNIDKGINTPNIVIGLSSGGHNYKLSLAGYQDATGTFNITIGSTTTVPTVTLTPSPTGNASFTSNPSGARIWVDNIDKGINTPNTVTNLSSGGHSYKLSLTGYADATGTFNVTGGSTTTVPIVIFAPSAYFTSNPSGASIYIDNILQGTTPSTITNLSVGSHTYRLVMPGYNVSSGNFTATSGQTINVSMTLFGTAMAFLSAGD